MLRCVDAGIKNYPQLTAGSKFLYQSCLDCGTLVINEENMPQLYQYIQEICTTAKIPTPIVLVTILPGSCNAAAIKLLINSGVVMIGRDMFIETDDEEVEAVLAHEIGHIKHDHVNKKSFLHAGLAGLSLLSRAIMYHLVKDRPSWGEHPIAFNLLLGVVAGNVSEWLSKLIINKRF